MDEELGTGSGVPKDLGVVIGTPEQALWRTLKEQAEKRIQDNKVMGEIDSKIIEMAEEKLKDLKLSK